MWQLQVKFISRNQMWFSIVFGNNPTNSILNPLEIWKYFENETEIKISLISKPYIPFNPSFIHFVLAESLRDIRRTTNECKIWRPYKCFVSRSSIRCCETGSFWKFVWRKRHRYFHLKWSKEILCLSVNSWQNQQLQVYAILISQRTFTHEWFTIKVNLNSSWSYVNQMSYSFSNKLENTNFIQLTKWKFAFKKKKNINLYL